MLIRPFERDDFKNIKLQSAQLHLQGDLTDELADKVAKDWVAFSAIKDGEVMAISGVMVYNGRNFGWSYLSKNSGKCLIGIIRGMKKVIKNHSELEIIVDAGFSEGKRMANLLGFKGAGKFEGSNFIHFKKG